MFFVKRTIKYSVLDLLVSGRDLKPAIYYSTLVMRKNIKLKL